MTMLRPRWYFFIALVSITFIGPLSLHLFIPAMSAVKEGFGVSTGMTQLTMSLAMLSMACFTVACGGLSGRFGRKPVLLSGLVLFTCGASACMVAGDMSMLLAGRVLQGASAGCGAHAAKIGLWFFAFPVGFMAGSFISGRINTNGSIEFMNTLGGVIGVANGALLAGWLYFGGVSMAALYIPGIFVSLARARPCRMLSRRDGGRCDATLSPRTASGEKLETALPSGLTAGSAGLNFSRKFALKGGTELCLVN